MGHFVCDACHNAGACDLIERCCSNTDCVSPVALAMTLMKNPAVKMHGPEHHFLVPAVLLTAFHAATNAGKGTLAERVREARKRSDDVKGGFCGFHGACGAAIGAGIFMSIVTDATPLTGAERRLSNLLTAECLLTIAKSGGARCCKRETFRAIVTAVEFVRRELGVSLPVDLVPACVFSAMNRECLRERCGFYRDAREVEIITPTQGAEIQCP
ncbi:MAG: DUF5714 domain-containing protein [Geobacteraceae bacterium]|nr:DUF5714 domain-containing protein [Geobacteraceae bacterium]